MDLARGARILRPEDPGYPLALKRIPDPPEKLHVMGKPAEGDILAVAIVGSRHPTPYGLHMARTLAGDLARAGITVVSGLARGVDMAAHRGALDAGGRTAAVLGCGLDIDYPRSAGELKRRIVRNGFLFTEFGNGTPPLPHHFPARNRIISGLSLGILVVEAGLRSGSLITARWALDQGREVMAVPGRADSPLSEGPINLIREGAAPVCGASDVIRTLNLDLSLPPKKQGASPDPVPALLSRGPCFPEEVSRSTGLPISRVLAELSRLLLEGKAEMDHSGAYYLK